MAKAKLLNLLYGDQLRRSPGKKIIPAEELGALVEAEEILKKVLTEAERFRLRVATESEQIKDEAQLIGFQKGLEGWSEQLASLEEHAKKVREEILAQILPIILQSAKKLVGRELEQNPETISDIVLNNLRAVSQHRRITIYCSAVDLETLDAKKDKLKGAFEHLETLSLQAREDVEPGGCIIETEAGIINAQLEQLWASLERVMKAFLEQQPVE